MTKVYTAVPGWVEEIDHRQEKAVGNARERGFPPRSFLNSLDAQAYYEEAYKFWQTIQDDFPYQEFNWYETELEGEVNLTKSATKTS